MMKAGIESKADAELRRLQVEEERLQGKMDYYDREAGGVLDLDAVLPLISTKLEILQLLIRQMEQAPAGERERNFRAARRRAHSALALYDALRQENISLDQRALLDEDPRMLRVQRGFQEFLLQGGSGFFDQSPAGRRESRLVARVIHRAIAKYHQSADKYEALFKPENLPPWLRRLANHFLPVLAREGQHDPPYGIEEGEEEEVYRAEKIKLPLSQAIYYLEQELLPELENQLAATPGDLLLERRLHTVREKLTEFKNIDLLPRARPLVQEKGFYTEVFAGYTPSGELLVSLALPVVYSSGTNLDRMQYHVRQEIVKNLAGKGICPELDREYRRLKSLESGREGSSRVPGMRLDGKKMFIPLKNRVPVLRLLDNKQEFQKLVTLVTGKSRRTALQTLEELVEKGPEPGEKGQGHAGRIPGSRRGSDIENRD